MQPIFDQLVDTYLENKVGITENFLNSALAMHLRQNLMVLHAGDAMKYAGTGNETIVSMDQKMRGDQIYWLDRLHNDPHENDFFDLMDQFVLYLNSTCYTGITGYEFHYTLYDKGSFYKKHLDQFHSDKRRAYSMIMYLNADWQQGDGGELCIHHSESQQNIPPLLGKSVFFKSDEMAHEVLLTNKARMSITGWLKTD